MSTFAQSTARISATAARRIASSARTRSVVARAGKQVIATDKAVAALGPYSQAIKHGNTIYVSGQIGLDPATGDFVGDDVESQTERVMLSISEILKAAGANMSDVVKCNIFVTNMGDFAAVNAIYAKSFPENPPARATVEVPTLPKGAKIEIDAIAMV